MMAEKYVQINRLLELKTEDMNYVYDLYDLDEYLAGIPEKDILNITRCRDCKFNVANIEKDPLDITDYSGDDIVCSYFMTDGLNPNDYCSQGKRTPKERGGEK